MRRREQQNARQIVIISFSEFSCLDNIKQKFNNFKNSIHLKVVYFK